MKNSFLFLAVLVFLGGVAFPVDAADSHRVNVGQSNIQITEHGICRKVSNTGTKDVFIPTKTSIEWSGFLAHLPSGVTAGSCILPYATTVSTSDYYGYSCALLNNGNVACWGGWSGPYGAYVGNSVMAVSAGSARTCHLLNNGNVSCFGSGTLGYSGGDAATVSAGGRCNCVLRSNKSPSCFGDAYCGLNHNTAITGNKTKMVSAGPHVNCAVLDSGNVHCFGGYADWDQGGYGKLGTGYSGGDAVSADVGGHWGGTTSMQRYRNFACALRSNGNVSCWGYAAGGYSGGDVRLP